jgi:hypothetical protein
MFPSYVGQRYRWIYTVEHGLLPIAINLYSTEELSQGNQVIACKKQTSLRARQL